MRPKALKKSNNLPQISGILDVVKLFGIFCVKVTSSNPVVAEHRPPDRTDGLPPDLMFLKPFFLFVIDATASTARGQCYKAFLRP
jgi:hypothetical protein